MVLTELYMIGDRPLPAPDGGLEMSFEDIDGPSAGRDESGYMHRDVVRRKVGVWNFRYSYMDRQTWEYLISVMPLEGSFSFTYPGADGKTATCTAYLSAYSAAWESAATGTYRDVKFSIIQC